jgi:hypothetical protein
MYDWHFVIGNTQRLPRHGPQNRSGSNRQATGQHFRRVGSLAMSRFGRSRLIVFIWNEETRGMEGRTNMAMLQGEVDRCEKYGYSSCRRRKFGIFCLRGDYV